MKNAVIIGVLLLVFGVMAFVVPIPHSESHGVKIGDAKIGVQTEHSEKLPPIVGIALLVAGVVVLATSTRKP
jgi:drug/metabolite transporter (DMT)-like permease